MKTKLFKATERGYFDHGWLKTYHTFSFAGYYEPEKVHFGTLRVLNDDTLDPGTGFGLHPHDNMEIITIPLRGSIEHQDSIGHREVIHAGEVQVMSAGSGIRHAEYNASQTEPLELFQIWILTKEKNIKPRYDQKAFDENGRTGKLQLLVSHTGEQDSLTIHQDAKLSRIDLVNGQLFEYQGIHENFGLFVMVIEGSVEIDGVIYNRRDGIGFWETSNLLVNIKKDTQLLFIEIPMVI